ncbi:MAG: tetratricopeptide repeat protein [Erysipelotrichaceae bacterium]|nr:tetratricopeptide repeat protein [Erysipelotrichaceae bacterium]
MEEKKGWLEKEDYEEPACVLCTPKQEDITPIPQQRIIGKMDEYMSKRDYAGAERHLLYWLEEAKIGHDQRGELLIRNELVGHYRKTGVKEKAFASIEEALRLLRELDFSENVSAGTTYINCATALNAFGKDERSLSLFEKAKEVYEKAAHVDPSLLGGLYNNMALTCTSLRRYAEAHAYYEKALQTMSKVEHGELEQAITCLNEADLYSAELGAEAAEKKIEGLLDRAEEFLNTPSLPRNGYYAFVCEKCAPSFSYYGYFLFAEELKKRAEEIYGRN